MPDGNWRRGEPAEGELTARTSPLRYRPPRKLSRMRSSRDPGVRLSAPDLDFASASLQSTQPLFQDRPGVVFDGALQGTVAGWRDDEQGARAQIGFARRRPRRRSPVTRVQLATMGGADANRDAKSASQDCAVEFAPQTGPRLMVSAVGSLCWSACRFDLPPAWWDCRSARLPRDGGGKSPPQSLTEMVNGSYR